MLCPDGNTRICIPIVSLWLADHAENATIHNIKMNSCCYCELEPSEFGNKLPKSRSKIRDYPLYYKKLITYEEGDDDAGHFLTSRGVKLSEGVFWGLNFISHRYTLVRPDTLHVIYLGILKHLMDWMVKFLTHHDRIGIFNLVWASMESFPGLKMLNKSYSVVTQWNGREMRQLLQIILPAFTATLVDPLPAQKQDFSTSIAATRHLVEFIILSQYRQHTDATLKRMEDCLNRFHDKKGVFLQFRAGKSSRGTAQALRKELTAKLSAENSALKMTATQKKAKLEADKLFINAEVRQHLESESNFDFVKFHTLGHFAEVIKLFGHLPGLACECGEYCHIELKNGFRRSNRNNATPQILTTCSRQDAFAYREMLSEHIRKKADPAYINGMNEPCRQLVGPVAGKQKLGIADITAEVEHLEISYKQMTEFIAEYLKRVCSRKVDAYRIANFRFRIFNGIDLPQEDSLDHSWGNCEELENLQSTNTIRCSGTRDWHRKPRNECVFVSSGDSSLYSDLKGRMPARIRSIFSFKDECGKIHRVALVSLFALRNRGKVEKPHGLIVLKEPEISPIRLKLEPGVTALVQLRSILVAAHVVGTLTSSKTK
jgi:hypothetical protein